MTDFFKVLNSLNEINNWINYSSYNGQDTKTKEGEIKPNAPEPIINIGLSF